MQNKSPGEVASLFLAVVTFQVKLKPWKPSSSGQQCPTRKGYLLNHRVDNQDYHCEVFL